LITITTAWAVVSTVASWKRPSWSARRGSVGSAASS